MTEEEVVYDELKKIARENKGMIIRFKEIEEERIFFSTSETPELHPTILEAAVWVRQNRPEGSSKYKTYVRKSVESGTSRSMVNDRGYAEDYKQAIEWIADESEKFCGERIEWLALPKKAMSVEEIDDE